MRARSGCIDSDSKMVSFLYVLIRDYVTPGIIEKIIKDNNKAGELKYAFTNGWLAEYAKDVEKRLLHKEENKQWQIT